MSTDSPDVDGDTSPIVLRTWSPDGSLESPNRPPVLADEGATAPGAVRALNPPPNHASPQETIEKYMRRWEDAVATSEPDTLHAEAFEARPRARRSQDPSLLLIAFGSFAGTLAAGGTALSVFLLVT